MRKFAVGLAIIALLAFAGESSAYPNGTADPLGLISSAVIQPFWTAGEYITLIELTSPVWFNSNLHGFWFNSACTRGNSFPIPLTRNDIEVFDVETKGAPLINGLVVIAGSTNFDDLSPIQSPIHSRGHWISFLADHIRTVDPIAVTSAETVDRSGLPQTYSPMRSAASYTNPQHVAAIAQTEIFLVCPTSTVYLSIPPSRGFPTPPATTSGVIGVVFDNEKPVIDVEIPCTCLTRVPDATISGLYSGVPDDQDDSVVPLWYTELVAYDPGFGRKVFRNGEADLAEAEEVEQLVQVKLPVKAFTGYRAIVWSSTPFGVSANGVDDFGRLHNASAGAYLYGLLGGR